MPDPAPGLIFVQNPGMRTTLRLRLFPAALLLAFTCSAQFPQIGCSLSPEGFPQSFDSIPSYLVEMTQNCPGGIVYASGKWYDTTITAGTAPGLTALCGIQPSPFNFTDAITLGWATWPVLYLNPQGGPNNWTNTLTRSLYLQAIAQSADSMPAYFFIGNEVNFYYPQDSIDYLNWVSFYEDAYDTIKAHSPQTRVGTNFNYEHMAGLGTNIVGWTTPYWQAYTLIDPNKIDVVGMNVYPFFRYDSVADIPGTYLDPLFNLVGNKPVLFNETGWPADSFPGVPSWICSETEQVNYVSKFFSLIAPHSNVEGANWLFLHYMMDYNSPEEKLFCSISLYDSLGVQRPAYQSWFSHCQVLSAPGNQAAASWKLTAQPNPFSTQTILRLEGPSEISDLDLEFTLYDVAGRQVRREKIATREWSLSRDGSGSGLYFYRITGTQGALLTSGKLVIE